MRPILHHIPVCPFSQRVEILLALKGSSESVTFKTVDITQAREPRLLALSGGATTLPLLELPDGRALQESLVLLEYFEKLIAEPSVRRQDPYERALEQLLGSQEGAFVRAGYGLVLNQDPERRSELVAEYLQTWQRLDVFLKKYSSGAGPFLFERFGWAETLLTPLFQRFAFVEYYEELPPPAECKRARQFRDACIAHPVAQQVSEEEIIKVYYDYALGAGNGQLLPGRRRSSFALDSDWRARPMPPRDKYGPAASDQELGLE